jgi:DNA-binding transcriptional LysR family regulator
MDQLRSLRVFARVIAEGSFAGAARALDLAPAVVTRAVAELEEHLGARLLNRTTRRLALTEIGEAYLERARRILRELDDADALAGASTKQLRGSLRVLSPPAFAVHQLARHLPRFRAKYPQVGLEVTAPGPVDMADENFDVSIVSVGQQPLQGDFIARRLARSAFRLERVLPQWRGVSLTVYAATPTRKHVPARTKAFVDFLVQTFGGSDSDPWLPNEVARRGRC